MQFLWVYLDELVGKGLDFSTILEFIVYTMAMLMSMALPLAMLLASIMTFGSLGENNELLAMKAAGISLYRIMKPVIVLSILLTFGSFYFYNQVIPVSYKKLIALMSSIRQLRPEIIVKEGIFSNDIDNYSIKVGRKKPNGEMLYDIMIYDHTDDKGSTIVTVADSGTMKITKDKKYMILNLYSGQTNTELQSNNKPTYPARTDKFTKESIFTVLQGMELERKDESIFKNQNRALTNDQLVYYVDSIARLLEKKRIEQCLSFSYMPPLAINIARLSRKDTAKIVKPVLTKYVNIDSAFTHGTANVRSGTINTALNNARNNLRFIQQNEEVIVSTKRNINRFDIEWHKKYTFAIACLIFLFIGAPLGAIIRKGGLGMPIVISVVLFIFYWIISTTGEKFSRESSDSVWSGVWLSTFIFMPWGIFLTYKAANDSVVFNIHAWGDFFKRIFRIGKKKEQETSN
jgi:lipopolysaccharide export system permease protein